jgi:hypothetical protein
VSVGQVVPMVVGWQITPRTSSSEQAGQAIHKTHFSRRLRNGTDDGGDTPVRRVEYGSQHFARASIVYVLTVVGLDDRGRQPGACCRR